MTTELRSGAELHESKSSHQGRMALRSRPWSIVTLMTLASVLSGGCVASSSHFKATHIHLSNNEAPPAQLDAPLFRDNVVAVDPKSLRVISNVISPTQKTAVSAQSSGGSATIRQDSPRAAQGKVQDLNVQSAEFNAQSVSLLLEPFQERNVGISEVKSESQILPVDDMEASESTAIEYFRSAIETLSPFRRPVSGDTSQQNDTMKRNEANEFPIEEFKINMAEIPSLEAIQKSSMTRPKKKNENPIEDSPKVKRQRFVRQSTQNDHPTQLKSFRTRNRQPQEKPSLPLVPSFPQLVQQSVEIIPQNYPGHFHPQNLQLVNYQNINAPRKVKRPTRSNNSRPPVHQSAAGPLAVPYAAYTTAIATNREVEDKTPVYRVRKSATRPNFALRPPSGPKPISRPLNTNQRFRSHTPEANLEILDPRVHNYAIDNFSPYAAYSSVQPSLERTNIPTLLYGARTSPVEAQPHSTAHPRREFSETESFPAYSTLSAVPYDDHTYASVQYQIPVPAYTHHFQVQANPYIPVVSLKNIYPNILNQPSSNIMNAVWPNVKPTYEETPPYLRDLNNSFETGPISPSAKSSKGTSSTPKPSEEKEEPPTIINHIHISERRRPGVDRELTIDSGSEDTEWVIHNSNQRSSESGVKNAAKVRLVSRKESRKHDDEETVVLRKVQSREKGEPIHLSKREYLRSSHPLMIGHRFTQAFRVANDHQVPEFYVKPVKVRVSEEKNDSPVADTGRGFFSTVMNFFGQSQSQQGKSKSVELERLSYKNYKPVYRDRFEELIANLDNDSFDAFLTAVKVNQIFNKSLKRLRKNNGLLSSSTLYSRRSGSLPKENTEELADRMVEDFVSVLFQEYPTVAHQIELNKPFIPSSEGVYRELFVHPQGQISRDNMNEYVGLHNFTENLNDFSNRYSGKTKQWADYMSHLLTEQFLKSVDVSQPVRENLDLMVNGISNEIVADRKYWKDTFSRGSSNVLTENFDEHKPKHLSGEIQVELGYNGTSDSVLHNVLSDILGNFIDFGSTSQATPQKNDQNLVQSPNDNDLEPLQLYANYNFPTHDVKECFGGDCSKSQSEIRRLFESKQYSSSLLEDHNILLDRLSWIFNEDPEQLQAKVIEYIQQKSNNSSGRTKTFGESNVEYVPLANRKEFVNLDGNGKHKLSTKDDWLLTSEKGSSTMNAEEIDLSLAYLAQAYPYFWANLLGSYPSEQSYWPVISNSPSGLSVPTGGVDISGLRNTYSGSFGTNGVPFRNFNVPPPKSLHVGQEIQEGLHLRDLQALRTPTGSFPTYGSKFNVGGGQQVLGGHLSPFDMQGVVRPDLTFPNMYPSMNPGRVHSLTPTGLERDMYPISGVGYWYGNRGIYGAGKLREWFKNTRRNKIKSNLKNIRASSSHLEDEKKSLSYDDYDYDDYEIKIRSEILKTSDDPTKGSDILAHENHKNHNPLDYKKIRKQKRKYKYNKNSEERRNSEDYYDNFSLEDERMRSTWSEEAVRDSSDQDSEIRISLIQELGKLRKQTRKQKPSDVKNSSNEGPINDVRRSSKINSEEILQKNASKSSTVDNTDSRVIINIGFPFPSTEDSTASIIPGESQETAEQPKSSTGFLGSLRYLFNSYIGNTGEPEEIDNAESQQLTERDSKHEEESLEKKIAFSHVDPKTRIHTIITTSSDEELDHQPSVGYRKTRKPSRSLPTRRKTSLVKNLTRGQGRPPPIDNVHGGSVNVQRFAHVNLPTETKKYFPLVDFEEVSFTETFLGDSSETFQTPKPLDQFDLDPLNPMKQKNMTKMADTVPKVMTQPGTIYFNGGPMVRYQTGDDSSRK